MGMREMQEGPQKGAECAQAAAASARPRLGVVGEGALRAGAHGLDDAQLFAPLRLRGHDAAAKVLDVGVQRGVPAGRPPAGSGAAARRRARGASSAGGAGGAAASGGGGAAAGGLAARRGRGSRGSGVGVCLQRARPRAGARPRRGCGRQRGRREQRTDGARPRQQRGRGRRAGAGARGAARQPPHPASRRGGARAARSC